jgi:hypothetical protein
MTKGNKQFRMQYQQPPVAQAPVQQPTLSAQQLAVGDVNGSNARQVSDRQQVFPEFGCR